MAKLKLTPKLVTSLISDVADKFGNKTSKELIENDRIISFCTCLECFIMDDCKLKDSDGHVTYYSPKYEFGEDTQFKDYMIIRITFPDDSILYYSPEGLVGMRHPWYLPEFFYKLKDSTFILTESEQNSLKELMAEENERDLMKKKREYINSLSKDELVELLMRFNF